MALVLGILGSRPLAAILDLEVQEPEAIAFLLLGGLVPTVLFGAILVEMVAQAGADGVLGLKGCCHLEPDFSRARALFERGDVNGALRAYRDYFRDNPGDPQPLFRAANMLTLEGRHAEARDLLREIQSRFSSRDEIWARASFRLAEMYRHQYKEADQAMCILRAVARRVPHTEQGLLAREWLADMKIRQSLAV